jgi:hypothetical protein
MAKFTIERTYDVPYYRQETYEAATLEEAVKMDKTNDSWEGAQACWDGCTDDKVTGAWEGDQAYANTDLTDEAKKFAGEQE